MSIFNLFKRKDTKMEKPNLTLSEENTIPYVEKELFVAEKETSEIEEVSKPNPLEQVLSRDYSWLGLNDGFAHPDKDFLDQSIAAIRSDFRLAVDKCMDHLREELNKIQLHLIDIKGISTRMESKLKEKIKQLESRIHELDTQKILSIESEGMVSSAIHSYKLGFIQGIEKYQQEKLFLESGEIFTSNLKQSICLK